MMYVQVVEKFLIDNFCDFFVDGLFPFPVVSLFFWGEMGPSRYPMIISIVESYRRRQVIKILNIYLGP